MPLWAAIALAHLETARYIGFPCQTADCAGLARWICSWPGREPARKCDHHKRWMDHVAGALGFALHWTPVEVRDLNPDHGDYTAERFAAMELT